MKQPWLAQVRSLVRDAALRRLARNTGWLLTAEIVVTLIGIVQFPLVARLLGVERFGTLHLVLSWVNMLGALFTIQVRETVIKYLSQFKGAGDEERALAIVKLTFGIEITLSVLVFALISVTATLVGPWIIKSPEASDLIRLEAFRQLLLATSAASTAILRVYDRFKWLSAFNAISAIAIFGLVAGALLAGWGVAGYILAFIVITAGQTTALYVASQRELRTHFGRRWWRANLSSLDGQKREIGVMLFSMNLDALRKITTGNADIVILGLLTGSYNVGLYRLAKQLAGYVNRLTNPLYTTLHPEIARLYNTEGRARMQQFVRRLARGLALGVGVLILGALLLARPFVPFIFGAEYIPAIPIFYITMFMHVWLIFIWAPAVLLTLGKARQLTTINLISSLVMLLALFALIPIWQEYGAALALVSNYMIWTLLAGWYLKRLPDLHPQV